MKNNFTKYVNYFIRVTVLVLVVMFVQTKSNVKEIKQENENLNKTLDLTAMSKKVQEDIYNDLYSAKDTFIGDLTGYGADCPLCTGKLSCMPSLDVLHGNVNYTDSIYGKVRIVASSKNLACGTIVRLNSNRVSKDEQLAIVLDRGVLGKDLDLLMPSEHDALVSVGRSSISYDVLRFGWER